MPLTSITPFARLSEKGRCFVAQALISIKEHVDSQAGEIITITIPGGVADRTVNYLESIINKRKLPVKLDKSEQKKEKATMGKKILRNMPEFKILDENLKEPTKEIASVIKKLRAKKDSSATSVYLDSLTDAQFEALADEKVLFALERYFIGQNLCNHFRIRRGEETCAEFHI